jgi:hypothetical protein
MATKPLVACLDEADCEFPIVQVRSLGAWHWRRVEVVKRREEPHGRAIIGNQDLQKKELHARLEAVEGQ